MFFLSPHSIQLIKSICQVETKQNYVMNTKYYCYVYTWALSYLFNCLISLFQEPMQPKTTEAVTTQGGGLQVCGLRFLAIFCAVICGFAVFGQFICGFAVSGKQLRFCGFWPYLHAVCGDRSFYQQFCGINAFYLRFYRLNLHSFMTLCSTGVSLMIE